MAIWGCHNSNSTTEPINNVPQYVPGEIAVGFVDSVSYNFVVNYFNSPNLSIIELGLGYNLWFKADSNDVQRYSNVFFNDTTLVSFNDFNFGLSGDTVIISISFNGKSTLESELSKARAARLNIYQVNNNSKYALLKTIPGLEQYWIENLKHDLFIRYAELNYIMHID